MGLFLGCWGRSPVPLALISKFSQRVLGKLLLPLGEHGSSCCCCCRPSKATYRFTLLLYTAATSAECAVAAQV
jgi:hypothetical protein